VQESSNVVADVSDSSSTIAVKVQHVGIDVMTNQTNAYQYRQGGSTSTSGTGSGSGLLDTAAPGNDTISFTATFAANGPSTNYMTVATANVAAGGYTMAINQNGNTGLVITGPAGLVYSDPSFGRLTATTPGGAYTSQQLPISLPNGGEIGVNYNSGLTSLGLAGSLAPAERVENDSSFTWSLNINSA
jgi:hypothetical protein